MIKKWISSALIVLILSGAATAQNRRDFYEYRFDRSGIPICPVGSANCQDFYLILTSGLPEGELSIKELGKKFLLICDTAAEFVEFYCDAHTISSKSIPLTAIDPQATTNAYFQTSALADVYILAVPEQALLLESSMTSLDSFLKQTTGIFFFETPSANSAKAPGTVFISYKNYVEIGFYLAVFILLYTAFIFFYRELTKNSSGVFSFKFYLAKLTTFSNFIYNNRAFPSYALIFLLILYGYLLILVSLNDLKNVSINYMVTYFLQTVTLSKFGVYIQNNNTLLLSFVFLNLVILTLVYILLFPLLLSSATKYLKKIPLVETKYLAVSVLGALGLITSSLYTNSLVVLALILSILLTTTSFGGSRTLPQSVKKTIFALFLLLFACTLYIGGTLKKEPLSVNRTPFSDDSPIVYFPKHIFLKNNVLFQNYVVKSDVPVFADAYMLFHPEYKEVVNKPILEIDLSKSETYGVLFSGMDSFVSTIASGQLREDFQSEIPTNIVSAIPRLGSPVQVSITLSCLQNQVLTVPLDMYFGPSSLEKRNIDTVRIPACSGTQGDKETFNIVLAPQDIPAEVFIVSPVEKDVAVLELTNADNITYYSYPQYGYLEFPMPEPTNVITLYSPDVQTRVEYTNAPQEFDLGQNLNILAQTRVGTDKIKLWNTENKSLLKVEQPNL